MEERRGSSPSVGWGSLSPPASSEFTHTYEGTGTGGTAADTVVAVQLASTASPCLLSTSVKDAAGSTVGATDTDAHTPQPSETIAHSSLTPSLAGAQPPEITWDREIREWQDTAIINPKGVSALSTPSSPRPYLNSLSEERHVSVQAVLSGPRDVGLVWMGSTGKAPGRHLLDLPNEVLLQILSNLEVCDLLMASRVRSGFRHSLIRTSLSFAFSVAGLWRSICCDYANYFSFALAKSVSWGVATAVASHSPSPVPSAEDPHQRSSEPTESVLSLGRGTSSFRQAGIHGKPSRSFVGYGRRMLPEKKQAR